MRYLKLFEDYDDLTDYNNWEEFKYYLELITNTFLDIEDELDWEKVDDMSQHLDQGTYYYIDNFNSKLVKLSPVNP